MNIKNYGFIKETHTGKNSENEVNNWWYMGWLETGLGNSTKVSGADNISRKDGTGNLQYKFFKGASTVWVDANNTTMIEYMKNNGWSSNPPETDYGYGSITVNGVEVPIYLPEYFNGTNSNFVNDGWVTLDDKSTKEFYRDTNWSKFIADIGSVYGEELAYVKVPLKDVIYVNGSNSGRVDNVGVVQNPYLALAMLAIEIIGSYEANSTNFYLTVTVQQKGDKYRTVLQLESNKNPMQDHAGQSYYYLDTDLLAPGRVHYVQALRDQLKSMGYGDYIKGDTKTNIYITMDKSHDTDASMGYITLKDGKLMLTPKLYKDDDMKIVNNTQFLGICTGHKVRLDVRKDLEKSECLSDYGINIVENAAEKGDIVFNK